MIHNGSSFFNLSTLVVGKLFKTVAQTIFYQMQKMFKYIPNERLVRFRFLTYHYQVHHIDACILLQDDVWKLRSQNFCIYHNEHRRDPRTLLAFWPLKFYQFRFPQHKSFMNYFYLHQIKNKVAEYGFKNAELGGTPLLYLSSKKITTTLWPC